MDILTIIVSSAEELVHTAVDRHVLPSTANDGVCPRDDDDQSYNPRPRHRHRQEQTIPIPCCKCMKWGKCSLKRPAKGCPCVAAKRPCTTGCATGCNCQNRNPWEDDTSDEEPPPGKRPKTTVRTPPRQNDRQTARGITAPPSGGKICLPALPAAPYPLIRPGASTTTPAATSRAGGDDPAATITPAGESDTSTPATLADGGVGDATPPRHRWRSTATGVRGRERRSARYPSNAGGGGG